MTKETAEFKETFGNVNPENAGIDFGKDKVYRRFKLAYQAASTSKPPAENFVFDEHVILTAYAKYMLEYVEGLRKNHRLKYFDAQKRQWKAAYPK